MACASSSAGRAPRRPEPGEAGGDGSPFLSFFAGGFECSTHRRPDGLRLDVLAATRHDRHAAADYAGLAMHGLRTVRDGLRWHLIEQRPGRYDWSSMLGQLEAAERSGTQVVWDLCHYGWPDGIDIWRPAFVERFAAFAAAAAELLRRRGVGPRCYAPVNEPSYFSWAGGQHARMHPLGCGRGLELKHQLIRATMAAMDAIRAVDPAARFLHIDPLVHVAAPAPELEDEAAAQRRAQYDAWLLMSGELWPGFGGDPSYLDIVGLNYYPQNQWLLGGGPIPVDHPQHRPLRLLLADAHRRLARPLYIAETGAEGDARGPWLDHVATEVAAAIDAGVPVLGVCMYPVLDYPGWSDDRHCATGLYGYADAAGVRPRHDPLGAALERAQARIGSLSRPGPASPPPAVVAAAPC